MTLAPGTQLGPYEIVALIGKGGMGQVYRARDPRMGRDVAIKVSAERFSERFDREVRAVAALNHPNICSIYDVGPNYLVMELVEGESPRGPLPLGEGLRIAAQIAAALEEAHEKGIVHRDLKPGNIKIKPDGTVKVLDFGLAKVTAPAAGATEDSPTLSMAATRAGVILGTAGYMSPEQAKGKSVDKRADIWAFGVVLYELIAGKRLFHGEDVTDTLAAVVREQPDLSAVPPRVRPLLQRCLEKDPKKRLRDIGDVDALLGASEAEAPPQAKVRPAWTPWAIAAALGAGMTIALWAPWRTPPPEPALARFQIPLPPKAAFSGQMSVSPDGRWITFLDLGAGSTSAVWIRPLEGLDARLLPGTEGATAAFWSPDSRFLAVAASGKIKKIDISGGPPQPVSDTTAPLVLGGDWNRDGVILFGDVNGPLLRVPAAGGSPSPVTAIDASRQENRHLFPVFLPDRRHFLYLRVGARPENTGLYVGSLDLKPQEQSLTAILATQQMVHYVPAPDGGVGHLLFLRDKTLIAQAFDPDRLQLSGSPVPLAEGVGSFINSAFFGVSKNGVLIYETGGAGAGSQLTWMDRQGKALGSATDPGVYLGIALSPDGTQVAVSRLDDPGNVSTIWLTQRGTTTRFTFTGFSLAPIWSPDGSRVAFASSTASGSDLFHGAANNPGKHEPLLQSSELKTPDDWSRDGRFLLYESQNPKTKSDLWVLPDPGKPPAGDRKPILFLGTEFNESQGRFSPDAKWIAYTSDQNGKPEIYVRPFPTPAGGGGQWQISQGGGTHPRWRRDGRELLYLAADSKLMATEVSGSNSSFQFATPKSLFDVPPVFVGTDLSTWDISPDGQRFLILTTAAANDNAPITVVLNWQVALQNRAR